MKKNLKKYKTGRKRGVSGRVCKKCGKDPYPNYFFCPSCHRKISEHDDDDDFFYSGEAVLQIGKFY